MKGRDVRLTSSDCCCHAGHTSGVFISTCSSNPRSQQACAFLAAVVSNKTLVAELYIPRNTALPDRWIGILSPPYRHTNKNRSSSSTVKSRGCSAENGGTDSSSSSGGGCVGSGGASSSSGCSASGEPGLELWLSNSVQLHQPQKQQPAGVAAGGGRGNRGRRARHASAVGGAGGNRGSCWAGIYKLIMDCIRRSIAGLQRSHHGAFTWLGGSAPPQCRMPKVRKSIRINTPVADGVHQQPFCLLPLSCPTRSRQCQPLQGGTGHYSRTARDPRSSSH